jgi:pimeloyl-ACP methyl ester carboxylesterase
MANVAGQRLHFIHQRGKGPSPIPLLIIHGWPGLFLEMVELVGPLTDPERHGGKAEDAFDVVIPSIPGYAFSQHPGTVGLTPKAVADRFTSPGRSGSNSG